jgi:hypothetical protein
MFHSRKIIFEILLKLLKLYPIPYFRAIKRKVSMTARIDAAKKTS